jgi:hypothetical protein
MPWLDEMPAHRGAFFNSTFLDGMGFMLRKQTIAPDSGTINLNPAFRHVTICCHCGATLPNEDYTS